MSAHRDSFFVTNKDIIIMTTTIIIIYKPFEYYNGFWSKWEKDVTTIRMNASHFIYA
jgi:hypothetical protein